MGLAVRLQLEARKLLRRDLLSPRFYARRMAKQSWGRAVGSFLQTKFPYAFPLPAVPYVIVLELTTFCNLRCGMCPSPTLKSPRGTMSMAVYEKVLREAVTGGAHRFRFVGLGEPLLHPRLPQMIEMAKRAGLYTEVSTNATLLTPMLGQALLDAGLDEIGFSLDSADEAEYERIREGGCYREVVRNVETFLEMCKQRPDPPVTTARKVVMNGESVDAFSKQWSGKVDSLQFNVMRVYAGTKLAKEQPSREVPRTPLKPVKSRARCRQIMNHMIINWDGSVNLCNQSSRLIGNVQTAQLQELWRGKAIAQVRALHQDFNGNRLDICRICPVMAPATVEGDLGEEAQVSLRQAFDNSPQGE